MARIPSIRQRLEETRGQGRAAFIPFLMAGDPDLEWTGKMVRGLTRAGADIIELGVPFSDPVADGPVNQRAAERALAKGTTLKRILALVAELRINGDDCPIVLFSYFNTILRMGLEHFAQTAAKAGVNGVLVVDLPPEEAAEYTSIMRLNKLDTVFLASPTTTPQRLKLIDDASTGFVYYVSRLGVTGKKTQISETLSRELDSVRQHVSQPIAVGFGVSSPSQVHHLSQHADGVVVGSALVQYNDKHDPETACQKIESLCRDLASATSLNKIHS